MSHHMEKIKTAINHTIKTIILGSIGIIGAAIFTVIMLVIMLVGGNPV